MIYDFLGSIFIKNTLVELEASLNSIYQQSLKPNAVILVIDGPLNFDIDNILLKFENILNIKTHFLKNNLGLGIALREGLKLSDAEYILRFDIDDYNFPMRAQKQLNFMKNGSYDISSTYVSEFKSEPDNILRIKKVPKSQNLIKLFLPFRNPFNHPSICFKRTSIINIGSYRNLPFYEDYDLWIRAASKGCKFANLDEVLVSMNVDQMVSRRIGLTQIISSIKLFSTFWVYSKKNFLIYIPAFFIRTIIFLLPEKVLELVYIKILRK